MNSPQNMAKTIIVTGALQFSLEVPAAKIKRLQDNFPIAHWVMKENSFSETFLFLGTKFYGVDLMDSLIRNSDIGQGGQVILLKTQASFQVLFLF